MTLVVDASVVVAGLLGAGADQSWAWQQLASAQLVAPHLMPAEAANSLRRAVRVGKLTSERASAAHRRLVALPVALFPYPAFADRVWELRDTVTACGAWYVALAEALDASLATLDARLASASGPRCAFALPPPL